MNLKTKMILLLILGAALSISMYMFISQNSIYRLDVFLFIALIFYPLALVYGRGVIMDVFHSVKTGPYRPFKKIDGKAGLGFVKGVFNTIIACIVVVFVGWIYGTHMAYKKYKLSTGSLIK